MAACRSQSQSSMADLFRASASPRRETHSLRATRFFIALLCLAMLFGSSALGAISLDASASKDGSAASTTIASPTFATSSPNELILAFIATDYLSGTNTTVKSVAGAGLTWTLVVRANGQSGSSEIWRAFAAAPVSNATVTATLSQSVVASISVMSFAGVNTSGTNGSGAIGATGSKSAASGAPTVSLVTTASNSWVLGVGNDFDKAVARTLGTGQTLVHQYLTPTGDTYWVQRQTNPIALSGTTVTINDTAPTADRYNLSSVEVVAATTVGSTWSISGTITGGSGATVTLSGSASATTTADGSGNYTFTGLANGSYAVTPSKSGFTFSPANSPVTVNGANQGGVNFAATATTWSISGTISGGSGATVTLSGAASATTTADGSGNYTFTGLANGPYTVTPSKTGLTFSPANSAVTVNGANQGGVNFTATSTTWSISGTISGGSGATVTLSGAASATTTADGSGNYTFTGLANGSYTVTPSKSGFTFSPANSPVTVNGANQGGVNFTATSTTWSISGTISGGSGATVTLSGAASGTTTADGSGNYTFTGLANGSYTVTPSKSGLTFSPANSAVTVNGANQSGVNFTATSTTWSISGTISGGSGATVTLSGAASATTTADGSGSYTFTGLANGSYTVTPSKSGFTFSPANSPVTVNGANQSAINFTAQGAGWSIAGTISPAAGGVGATVTLSGAASATTTADASGNYTFTGLANGSYTVTPSKNTYTFTPVNQQVTVSGSNQTAINFAAVAPSNSITLDVDMSKDGASASTSITSPSFSTSTSNELILAFVATDYLGGTNTSVLSVTGGGLAWTLVVRTNGQSGSSEIWRAFASAQVSASTVTANLSQSVISSITVMSFAGVNSSGTNGSGAIGAIASKSAAKAAPTASLVTTANNSWVLGVGNDFDNAIARAVGSGQTLVHQYLTPTGDTYWVQRETNPVSLAGTTATINDSAPTGDRYNLSIVEVLAGSGGAIATPPTVSMTSPAQGALVSNLVTVSAMASDAIAVSGVQFLLDGYPLGAVITTPPYSMAWDTTTVSNGPHTLAAQAGDTVGLFTTSSNVAITVDNSSSASVVGSWSSPVTLPAVAVNLILLHTNKVLFYQDGATPTVWDYQLGTFTNLPVTPNLFCSGHALLADGRVLVVGGYGESSNTIGISNAEIFDPVSLTWTPVPNMQYRRWYPTATTLSDGRILVTAGWQTTAHSNAGISEIYDPATNAWTSLTNANNPFETYPFMYLMPDGRVIHIGGSEYATDTDVLDLTTNTWSVIDSHIVDGGSATMYSPGKFVKAGSATDSQGVGASSNTTFVLDMTQSSPSWQQTASMAYPRSYPNLTMLPDGSVLATGGETDKNGGTIANAVYAAELWSPQTKTWATMASMHTPREYHGTALLLPDGRVLESGMGADFGNVPDEKSAEFYSPPYLFKGSRPTITSSPGQIQYGTNFFVGTPDGATIASVSLIRTGAVTHFFDENERYLPLSFTQTSGGLTVTAPANANLAPPGYYMLFIVNSSGVPSIAPFVQVP